MSVGPALMFHLGAVFSVYLCALQISLSNETLLDIVIPSCFSIFVVFPCPTDITKV